MITFPAKLKNKRSNKRNTSKNLNCSNQDNNDELKRTISFNI